MRRCGRSMNRQDRNRGTFQDRQTDIQTDRQLDRQPSESDIVVRTVLQTVAQLEDVARKYHVMAALSNTGVEKNGAPFSATTRQTYMKSGIHG